LNRKLLAILTIIICISLILSYYYIFSKPTQLEIIWSKTYGKDKNEEGYYILSIEDEGCIVLGYTNSYSTKSQDILVMKIDKDGNKEWEKNYGGHGYEYGKAIIKVDDGYIIVGTSNSYGQFFYDYNAWLIKIDFTGNILWNKTYGESEEDGINTLVQTKEGDYVVAGYTYSYSENDGDLWIFKVNETGDLIWTSIFGGSDFDDGRAIVETNDGFVIAGETNSYSKNDGYSDAWLLKIDKTGNHIWNHTYDGFDYNDLFNQIIPSDNGFIMVGNSLNKIESQLYDEYYSNGFIVLTDDSGNLIYERILEEENETGISSIVKTEDGYLITGYIGEYGTGEGDILLEEIDKSINRKWMKVYGGDYGDAGIWTARGVENNYFITGYKDVEGTGFTDLWVMKLQLK
jgi:hypothetical protein